MILMVNKDRFGGLIPATITPMDENAQIDTDAYDEYLKWIMKQGVVGLAVNVDTGEGPTLTSDERVTLLEIARQRLRSPKILVAGLTAASTNQSVEEARKARDAGADAVLVFPNTAFRGHPPDPEAMRRHHLEIAEKADMDLILFQLQDALGGIELGEASLRALASLDRIVAIKEATFNFSKFKSTMKIIRELEAERGREIAYLTGNDNFILESYLWGCDGALIGAGAQDTARIARCYEACAEGNYAEAIELAKVFQPLVDAVFAPPVRAYRARTKACLYLQGVIPCRAVRQPLVEVPDSGLEPLRDALRSAGLPVVN